MVEGIERIKQKLVTELTNKKNYIGEQTSEQIAQIATETEQQIAKAQQQEQAWQEQYLAQAQQRLTANVNLERKRIRLEVNQQIIDELLYQLQTKMQQLNKNQKLALYLKHLPTEYIAGTTVVLAEADQALIADLQKALLERDQSWQQAQFVTDTSLSGGVKLQGEFLSEDHSFAELIRQHHYELLQIIKQELLTQE